MSIKEEFSKNDWNHFHDCVFNISGKKLNEKQLEETFETIPLTLKTEAYEWGMSDTLWREKFMEWYSDNQN